jgi:uncharacterized protein YggT (Ycf19 family)
MTDDKLIRDEAERAANYEAIKSNVKSEVGGEIVAEVDRVPSGRIENVADDMRAKAVNEVVQTQHEVERGRFAARISQIVDYIFFLIYGLLTIRLMLELFAAREGVAFFQFIKSVTNPIYSPFRGLVPSLTTPEGFSFELAILVALVVYILLHMAVNGLLRMIAHRKVEI